MILLLRVVALFLEGKPETSNATDRDKKSHRTPPSLQRPPKTYAHTRQGTHGDADGGRCTYYYCQTQFLPRPGEESTERGKLIRRERAGGSVENLHSVDQNYFHPWFVCWLADWLAVWQ